MPNKAWVFKLSAVILFSVMACRFETLAQTVVSTSLDGLYFGTVTPDAIQDNTRARCSNGTAPVGLYVTSGQATTIYYNGPVLGSVVADGHIEMSSAWSTVSLWPTASGLRGRILVGGGPWCKHTIELSKAASLPQPARQTDTGYKVFNARIEQDPGNPPGKCDRDGYEQRLWLRNGLAMMSWADGGTYGHVYEDGRIEMRGLERQVHLTREGNGFVGAATKRGCRANIVRTLLVSNTPK